jgi:cullin-4
MHVRYHGSFEMVSSGRNQHHQSPMSANQGTLKRKHSGKTIKELFTTQSKPHAATAAPLSPTKKRPRREPERESSPPADEAATARTAASAMSTADMYHFPSKRGDVVDMTASPDSSPARASAPRSTHGSRKTAPNMHPTGGPKRLLVKNFKPTRKVDPAVFLDQTWQKIDGALDTIFAQAAIDFSLEELYRGVENLCRQGMAKDVKERLVAKCRDYVGGSLTAKVHESLGRGNVEVLRATLQAWAVWNEQMVRTICSTAVSHDPY